MITMELAEHIEPRMAEARTRCPECDSQLRPAAVASNELTYFGVQVQLKTTVTVWLCSAKSLPLPEDTSMR